jgi:hypothetical protein
MRLSEWRKTAPNKDSMSNRVLAVLRPVLVDLGSEADAECWVVWGEDPELRYFVLAPTAAGLVTVNVRPGGAEAPRATAKLVRWSKLSVSELGVEASGGHRLVGVQVESIVLKGMDEEADRICEFVRGLIAGIDGRNPMVMPIAYAQPAPSKGSIVALATVSDEDRDGGPEPARSGPERSAAGPRPARPPKPRNEGAGKVVLIASKSGARQATSEAGSGSSPARVTAPGVSPEPVLVVVPQTSPTPIAARAAAAQQADKAAAGPTPGPGEGAGPAAEQPAAGQTEWIGPHPIEEKPLQAPEPPRPRPWAP